MDSADISPTLLRAGEEYLEALRRLRLAPEGLLWARVNELRGIKVNENGKLRDDFDDYPGGPWHLVLITSVLDEGGPSALNELLFKAYDASATPKEISPFIVEVLSAKSSFARHLVQSLSMPPLGPVSISYTTTDGRKVTEPASPSDGQTLVGGLWFDKKWIYHLSGLRDRHTDRRRHWLEFKQSVNALAA
ncbi:hypothetical protein D3C80_130350 [compost metagenome]